jgi:hypothetical protein
MPPAAHFVAREGKTHYFIFSFTLLCLLGAAMPNASRH